MVSDGETFRSGERVYALTDGWSPQVQEGELQYLGGAHGTGLTVVVGDSMSRSPPLGAGTWAEYVAVKESILAPHPGNVSSAVAGAAPLVATTAFMVMLE